MQILDRLAFLSDEDLLQQFGGLVGQDNERTAVLLRHIDEIDGRKLWAKYGHSSMFKFCVDRFHMSESVAGKRIGAARTARRFPVIFDMVARGELHLSGIHVLKTHLTEENHQAVLGEAKHMTISETEGLVARIAPKPDVPSRIRKLPERRPTAPEPALLSPSPSPPADTKAEGQPTMLGFTAAAPVADDAKARVPRAPNPKPLSPRRYKLEVTIGQDAHGRIEKLQALLAHQIPDGDPAAIVERALEVLLEQTLKKKAALTEKPRAAERKTTGRSRRIPAGVRRQVWDRDEGQCTFVAEDGRHCGETRCLEYAHRQPWAKGGEHTVENLGLRCRAHNAYEADRDYGEDFMAKKRDRADRARESVARYLPSAPTPARDWMRTVACHPTGGIPLASSAAGPPDMAGLATWPTIADTGGRLTQPVAR